MMISCVTIIEHRLHGTYNRLSYLTLRDFLQELLTVNDSFFQSFFSRR